MPEFQSHLRILALAYAHYARLYAEALNPDLFTNAALVHYKDDDIHECVFYADNLRIPSAQPVGQPTELRGIKIRINTKHITLAMLWGECQESYQYFFFFYFFFFFF
jgi:hypothetical protein